MPPKPITLPQYQISVSTDYDLNQLKFDWLKIESQIQAPFFLSWAWISTWIQSYSPAIIIVKVEYQGQLVALGLFTSSTERRHFVINAKQLRMLQIGSVSKDQIWVEYNDFICQKEHQIEAVNAGIKHLIKHNLFSSHDEMILSMIVKSRADNIVHSVPKSEILFTRPCYSVDLDAIRTQNKDYLQSLKSNTRYQIRRSIRHYEKSHGKVELIHSTSTDEALSFFDETAPLHIQRWYDSGFKNPEFIKFHKSLIEKFYNEGRIHLIKVKAGDSVIAILYYLINNGCVSFYLQGLLYEQDKMLKPGLVAHSLATQYFIDNGMMIYDYMGGYSQYKTQLANRSEDLATIRIQKPILKFILENTAQTIKNLVTRKK